MFNEKRFRLKVHQYGPGGAGEGGGGSPGGPGGPGGTGPGGPGPGGGPSGLGMGGIFGDFSGDFGDPNGANFGLNRQGQRNFMDTILNLTPVALMNAILYGGTGETFGSIAQGDPSGTPPSGGPGLDYTAPVSQTSRAITQAVTAPVEQPITPPLVDDRQRKRVGRQETILTSRSALSDAPTFRPTLLGQ